MKRLMPLLVGMLLWSGANAALEQGAYLGTFSGNDSEASMLADLGLDVNLIARVERPDTMTDGLTISELVFNDDNPPEVISGEWSYDGPEIVGYIVIKAGNEYAVYDYTNVAMTNMGIWDTADVMNKGLSHITAYEAKAIPVPAAVWLMASGLAGLGLMRRNK
ncbi:MAG: VPLPA-CTERM sorting domain-containing protein [Gammaproteobacteria bacterium]|nr:VPLPA-CTERM sorting domain-containing protein [Gammaproteobacteria bacterium]